MRIANKEKTNVCISPAEIEVGLLLMHAVSSEYKMKWQVHRSLHYSILNYVNIFQHCTNKTSTSEQISKSQTTQRIQNSEKRKKK